MSCGLINVLFVGLLVNAEAAHRRYRGYDGTIEALLIPRLFGFGNVPGLVNRQSTQAVRCHFDTAFTAKSRHPQSPDDNPGPYRI